MKCWDSFLDSWTSALLSSDVKKEKQEHEQTAIDVLRAKGAYFLKVESNSMKLYSHVLNIADTVLFNPEYLDKNMAVVGLSLIYIVIFKLVNFSSLGQPKNPVLREHILDCRSSSPLNLVFRRFLDHLNLTIDFDCFSKELRFAELYLSFPLLTESQFAGSVQALQDSNLLKPVRGDNEELLPRPSDSPAALLSISRL